jgi:tetraacyldisaccharide 4'-kinase
MHDWLQETWYGRTGRGAWLAPLAWLFGVVAAVRQASFRSGFRAVERLAVPVIVIGNITVGGTGKTPLVAWLAQQLAARGHRVGIVSRGYGGSVRGAERVMLPPDPARVGDEPAMLAARRCARVAVGADRPAAGRLLERDCDVILSDDGLQHLALARDAEIVVVDGERGLGNGRLLPAGPLREPGARLATVDLVVVNGPGYSPQGAVRMRLEPVAAVSLLTGERKPLEWFRGALVHAVAAIGNPGRFFAALAAAGLDVRPHRLPDHTRLESRHIEFGDSLPVLMTEKDAVKCRGFARAAHWYVEVEPRFDADGEARLLSVVERAMTSRS